MAEQTCGCQSGDVPVSEVSKTIDQQLASLDPQRADALERLQTVRSARGAGYVREQARLARKYGGDDPRVTALTDKIRVNDGLRRDVGLETDRASTPAPVVDSTRYVFHGFVRDLKGQAVPHLTIALYDANANWIRELGYGCTDERGYFRMEFQRGKTAPATAPQSIRAALSTGAAKAEAAGALNPEARIYVLDAKKTTLQIEKEPLHPALGEVDFRMIILGADSCVCTPPPQQPSEPAPKDPPASTSTPLEEIRGIGPARARKLRAAGIKDVETFLKTEGAKLVEIAGFDADAVKRDAAAALKRAKTK